MAKRKLTVLSLHEKVKLIEVDSGNLKKKDIAAKFGIPASTLSTILKNRENLLNFANEATDPKRKRMKVAKYPDLEEAVLKWFRLVREQNFPVSGTLIREKAQWFAEKLGHTDFQASVGWLDKFRARNSVVFKAVCGESANVDESNCDTWIRDVLSRILSEYEQDDIFNADETGLFYKCLPDKTMAFKSDACHGGKRSKDRVTLMIAANMSGKEKLPLLLIGKSKKPRCFSHVKTLPVLYENNRKAWMTCEIYESWLQKMDKKFSSQNRKVLFLVDNCPAHPKVLTKELKAIKVAFFPPNLTSKLQPMDQGVIKNLKHFYRKAIVARLISAIDEKKSPEITLLDCVREVHKAWESVKPATIAHCFQKAGFFSHPTTEEQAQVDYPDTIYDEDTCEYDWNLLQEQSLVPKDVTFENYANIDDKLAISSYPSDTEIVESILNEEDETVDDEDDAHDGFNPSTVPTVQEAFGAVETLRHFVESRESVDHSVFQAIAHLDIFVLKENRKSKRQTKVTVFFNKC